MKQHTPKNHKTTEKRWHQKPTLQNSPCSLCTPHTHTIHTHPHCRTPRQFCAPHAHFVQSVHSMCTTRLRHRNAVPVVLRCLFDVFPCGRWCQAWDGVAKVSQVRRFQRCQASVCGQRIRLQVSATRGQVRNERPHAK